MRRLYLYDATIALQVEGMCFFCTLKVYQNYIFESYKSGKSLKLSDLDLYLLR